MFSLADIEQAPPHRACFFSGHAVKPVYWELEMAADFSRFAMLALECVHRQYPNKIAHHLNSDAVVERVTGWLPKLTRPVRSGEHSQTAFALALMLDWARIAGTREFEGLLRSRISGFFLNDRDAPLAYEPSGEDFLSPALAEADLMRRILAPAGFAVWLKQFLPGIPADGGAGWLKPSVVT